jgi:hypothetical protein
VTTLTGSPLTSLTLQPGQPASYRVAVTDADVLVGRPFTVQTQNGNLYRVDGVAYDYDDPIPASAVSAGVLPVDVAGLGVDLTPAYRIAGDDLGTLLDLTPCLDALAGITLGGLLTSTTVCTQYLTARLSVGSPLADVPVAGAVITDLDLTGLADDLLPLDVLTGGAYTDPSFVGIGAADPAAAGAPAATSRPVMRSPGLGALPQDLLAAITARVGTVTGGVDGALPASTVLQGLSATGNALVSTLVTTIGGQAGPVQEQLLSTLFTVTARAPVLSDLSGLVGTYTTAPSLTVSPPPGTPAGAYRGTHTITLLDQ